MRGIIGLRDNYGGEKWFYCYAVIQLLEGFV
jgi:hypothetical protein